MPNAGFHSEAKERVRVKNQAEDAQDLLGSLVVLTFQAVKYGACFDIPLIAWSFPLLVSVGFMVHKV